MDSHPYAAGELPGAGRASSRRSGGAFWVRSLRGVVSTSQVDCGRDYCFWLLAALITQSVIPSLAHRLGWEALFQNAQ